MEGKSAGYYGNVGEKRKRRRRERNTPKGTGMPVKKWKD
jgi:hypothetical protein